MSEAAAQAPAASSASRSDEWSAIRITTSTSMQPVVTRAIAHLMEPSNGPLVLHSNSLQPSTAASSSTSVTDRPDAKKVASKSRSLASTHSGLCKLISIVEIIKREFGETQRVWRAEEHKRLNREAQLARNASGSKEAHQGDKTSSKGKKRARDDSQGQLCADGPSHVDLARTDRATTSNDETNKQKTSLLRVYQYNELTCYEHSPQEEPPNGNDSSAPVPDEDETEPDEQDAGDDQVPPVAEPKQSGAAGKLDKAIQNQVVRGNRRPKKRHTPVMKITLATTRLPAYEQELKTRGNDFTIQYPDRPKRKRSRRSGKAGGEENGKAAESCDIDVTKASQLNNVGAS